MSAATRRLAEAILAQDDALDVEELDALIQAEIRAVVGTPNPEPVNTIESIRQDEGYDEITLRPVVTDEGVLQWELYIPATTRSAFLDSDEPDFDPETHEVKDAFEGTYWTSLQGAVTSLAISVSLGDVKFNDGRVAR